MKNSKVQTLSSFAWSIAEILRGDFKQSEYGKVFYHLLFCAVWIAF